MRKQLPFPSFKRMSASHGGSLSLRKRKTFRPVDPKQALHVVLRSSKARGKLSFLHPAHCNRIESHVRKVARKWGVKVERFANVGNHLHLLIRIPSRAAWQNFSREMSGGIAQIVTGARKGHELGRKRDKTVPESAQRAFWDHLVFTRIVSLGRDFKTVSAYIVKNLFEAAGVPMKCLQAEGLRLLFIDGDGGISTTLSSKPA